MPDSVHDTAEYDQDLINQFITESSEALADMDSLFVLLEKTPDDHNIIDSIFRPIHSIKGNSSFFGLDNIKNFSHAMENVLQEIRNGKCNISMSIIDCLLAGVDKLRAMLERLALGGITTALEPEEERLRTKFIQLTESVETTSEELAKKLQDNIKSLFTTEIPPEAVSILTEIQKETLSLLQELCLIKADISEYPDAAFSFYIGELCIDYELTVISNFIGDIQNAQRDQGLCEEFVKILSLMKAESGKNNSSSLMQSISTLEEDFIAIHNSDADFDDLLASVMQESLDEIIKEIDKKEKITSAFHENPETEKATSPPKTSDLGKSQRNNANPGTRTLRVAEKKVDHFMSYVGELIVAREIFTQIEKKLDGYSQVKNVAKEFKNANLAFNELSNSLQESLMAVRQMPMHSATQKLPRIVRDLSNSMKKDVEFIMEMDGVEIDKSLIECIENPLVHMVRNSLDHGIETPEERIAAGKPSKGQIRVMAEKGKDSFYLSVHDDGAGLDVNNIKAKAIAKGIISQKAADMMTEHEAYQLIFHAGISTAKNVTDVSGRGVGMDVVISNITNLNGKVSVESELGKGTTINIHLPLTASLLVTEGIIIRIGIERYIIPLADVSELVKPKVEEVSTVVGKGEMLNIRGKLYPMLRMYEILGVEPAKREPSEAIIVLVESKGCTCGLMVDDLIGQQSVVLKEIDSLFETPPFIKGTAILGDYRVALVLDISALIKLNDST